jgi:UDP-N-acetylglucosamine--N-acetylmuramyl-(pentapeptide) pyrophosphoryl-undecaprenol N-acetylglucosamine transferase
VMGGSQGAHRLNEVASDAICRLQAVEPVQVIHLAGGRDAAGIENRYAERGVSARVFPFLAEMDRAYAMSNLAITRAGAATCFELAAFGVPALLVPLPTASRNHQQANAEAMSREGCAEVVDEAGLTGEKLAAYISDMRRRPEKRASMQRAMRKVAAPESAPALADLVEAVAALR